ncbi:hypothetical protein [Bacteroides sp. 51]|uniref:hypothetical protein n=1 Tax=Bacteroides sp. 51 TaxID=2302938 RepID=UPI0013D627B5|nr:hypothetical protein [Bacteroides sp. 51]
MKLITQNLQALYDAMPEESRKSELAESIYLSLNQPKVVGIGDDMAVCEVKRHPPTPSQAR